MVQQVGLPRGTFTHILAFLYLSSPGYVCDKKVDVLIMGISKTNYLA